ncbi:MAG TPA: hypothetical protein VLB86_13495 [Gaiellaceae bacterium]|nr:hypothetical protein [Gaiellaceae bacterium]
MDLHITRLDARRRALGRLRAIAARPPRGPGSPPAGRPPRYKQALLTWAAAYAVITVVLAATGPAMASWPLALRTLVLSAVMVTALTWLIMPVLTRLFRGWLSPGG